MSFRHLRLSAATALIAVTLGLAVGCGVGTPAVSSGGTKIGPHGGVARPIGAGYAEVLIDKDFKKKGAKPRIVVYFLGPDAKTALASAPTDVSVKAVPPVGEPSTALLSAEGDRFVSPFGDYDHDELQGVVSATVGGQPLTVNFAFR